MFTSSMAEEAAMEAGCPKELGAVMESRPAGEGSSQLRGDFPGGDLEPG